MARVAYLDQRDLAAGDQELLARPINLFRALAHSPAALAQWSRFGDWIRYHAAVDPRLRELAIVQVGLSAGNSYEVSHHAKIALDFGASAADLHGLAAVAAGQPAGHFSQLDRAVLAVARQVNADGSVDDGDWQLLCAALGQSAAVELTVIIGFYSMVVRVLGALAVDVEPEYQQYLSFFPGLRADAGDDAAGRRP